MNVKKNFRRSTTVAAKTVTTIAILTALSVVFSLLFTFRVGTFLKFSPVFIVIALAANKYGVIGATLVAVLSDFIQYLMFPANGFSFGILASNLLLGVIFGICLYKKTSITRILLAAGLSQIICTVGITTLSWVYVEKWYPTISSIVYWRILQGSIMFVVITLLLYILFIKTNVLKKLGFN